MATQSRKPVILLTRPAAQSLRFARALRARIPDAAILISPLIAPTLVSPVIPARDWAALIFSSETAVLAARRIVADGTVLPRRAFCVGEQTALVAREAGFEPLSAGGDGQALFALIRAQATAGPLLYLCGREARFDLGQSLSVAGLETVSIVVYTQDDQPLTAEAALLLQGDGPVIAPVFSPRSGLVLSRELARTGHRAPLHVVAISPAAAAAFPSHDLTIADHPDAAAMAQAVIKCLLPLTPP